MIALGVNPSFVEDTSGFHAGTRGTTDDSREFVYQRAGEAIGQHDAVEVDMAAGQAWQLSASRTSGESGNPVGVAHEALAEGEFGWFQVWGTATVRTVQETLAEGAELWPGSVAGALDHTQGARPVDGLFVNGGQNNLATVSLTYPRIAAQTSTGTGSSNVPDKPATPSQDTQYNLNITSGGVASWTEDDGSMAVDQTARDAAASAKTAADSAATAAATADDKAVAARTAADNAQATADSKSNVPNAPNRSVADARYNLQVATDGTTTWQVDDGGSGTGDPITDDQIPDDITRDSELQATAQALEGEIVDSLSLDRWKGYWRFPHTWADNDEVAYEKTDNSIGLYRRRAGQAGEDRTQLDNPEANSTGEASPWIALSGRGELNAQLHWLASGMSKGGETNQFLKKTSGRDFETEWATIRDGDDGENAKWLIYLYLANSSATTPDRPENVRYDYVNDLFNLQNVANWGEDFTRYHPESVPYLWRAEFWVDPDNYTNGAVIPQSDWTIHSMARPSPLTDGAVLARKSHQNGWHGTALRDICNFVNKLHAPGGRNPCRQSVTARRSFFKSTAAAK